MRNLLGLIIATFCLMWMPTQAQAAKQGKAGNIFRDCPSCPEMVVIPSGSFDMGSPGSEAGRCLLYTSEDSLWHIGKVKAETILPPIYGQTWGYRERARISVRHVIKKGKTLVGFHEKRSSFVADMQSCEILTPKIAALIPLLAELVGSLSIRDKLPQIEVAVGEFVDALVLRVMEPPTSEDEAALRAFADKHEIQFWLDVYKRQTRRRLPSGWL